MNTRSTMARQLESQLQVALQQLNVYKKQCEQLVKEREDSEVEIIEIVKKNSSIKNEMVELHAQLQEIREERDHLKRQSREFDKCYDEYDNNLKTIALLRSQLASALERVEQLEQEASQARSQCTQNLFSELLNVSGTPASSQPVTIDLTGDDSATCGTPSRVSLDIHPCLVRPGCEIIIRVPDLNNTFSPTETTSVQPSHTNNNVYYGVQTIEYNLNDSIDILIISENEPRNVTKRVLRETGSEVMKENTSKMHYGKVLSRNDDNKTVYLEIYCTNNNCGRKPIINYKFVSYTIPDSRRHACLRSCEISVDWNTDDIKIKEKYRNDAGNEDPDRNVTGNPEDIKTKKKYRYDTGGKDEDRKNIDSNDTVGKGTKTNETDPEDIKTKKKYRNDTGGMDEDRKNIDNNDTDSKDTKTNETDPPAPNYGLYVGVSLFLIILLLFIYFFISYRKKSRISSNEEVYSYVTPNQVMYTELYLDSPRLGLPNKNTISYSRIIGILKQR